jgi:AraC family transcriptional regulator of adaptative response/methylated-DNA-[protein]-cysteine methyltransferase
MFAGYGCQSPVVGSGGSVFQISWIDWSNKRFYEASNGILGMTPSRFRKGGAGEEIRFAVGETSLGSIFVASSTKGVAAILLGDDPDALSRDLQDRFPKARLIGADANYEAIVAKVVGFVEAPQVGLDLPLDVRGTAFQQRVWQALRDIPMGETVSYTDVAERIGAPSATRAVGGCLRSKQAGDRHPLPPRRAQQR